MVSTVGAPQKWLTSPAESMSHTFPASNLARQRCSPPIAVTAHVNAQPLQWNIGSVHRYAVRVSSRASAITPNVCRYAPRWVYMTPFGRPVVPLV